MTREIGTNQYIHTSENQIIGRNAIKERRKIGNPPTHMVPHCLKTLETIYEDSKTVEN